MEYSVIKEPVIPVLRKDGASGSVSIREAFLQAHEIRDILGDTPLERYALLRLLIAFAMDMLHPKNSYARKALLDSGKFDPDVFDDYVSICEKDGPRFDLFDAEHPFLQSKYNESLDSKAEKPVAAIIHSLPSGNNHVFIDHRRACTQAVSCMKAFHALVASYLFCVSGTAGPSSVNNTPPLYTIVIGKSLFETIVFNMLSESESKPLPYGTEQVPWRRYPEIIPKKMVASVTLLEGLTWMPRRILLIPEKDMSVRRVICQAGLDFRTNDLWNDPHVPKFKKKDGSFGTVKPELGRAVWRDVGTLLYDQNSAVVRQPQVLRCITNIFDEDELPIWIQIRAAGLITNQAAYTCWYENELSLPSELLCNQEMAEIFRSDISTIESMQERVYTNIQKYVDRLRPGSVTKEHEIATQGQQFFLQKAHDLLFGPVMDDILQRNMNINHSEWFCGLLQIILRDTINQVLRISGSDTKSMIQQMEAEKWIWFAFKKITEERKRLHA